MHINDKIKNNKQVHYLREYDSLQTIYNETRRDDFGNYISLKDEKYDK